MSPFGRVVKNENMQELISIAQENQYNYKEDTCNSVRIDTILNKRIE